MLLCSIRIRFPEYFLGGRCAFCPSRRQDRKGDGSPGGVPGRRAVPRPHRPGFHGTDLSRARITCGIAADSLMIPGRRAPKSTSKPGELAKTVGKNGSRSPIQMDRYIVLIVIKGTTCGQDSRIFGVSTDPATVVPTHPEVWIQEIRLISMKSHGIHVSTMRTGQLRGAKNPEQGDQSQVSYRPPLSSTEEIRRAQEQHPPR